MGKIMAIVALVVVSIVVIIGVPTIMYFSYNNKEVVLRNAIAAQQKANEAVYDETWKVITQVAQVAENYKDSFKEIYPKLMEGRYGNARGGALMSWIKESNPTFDTKLYEKLANAIEAQRANFTREQKKLLDIKQMHDNLIDVQPGRFFLVTIGGTQKIEVKIVTSSRTEKTFATGKDDDVNVFNKNKEN